MRFIFAPVHLEETFRQFISSTLGYPPPPIDKFVPLHEVPGDLSSPEYECFQHTSQVIRRRLSRRLAQKTIALLQTVDKNKRKVDTDEPSKDNESADDEEENNIPRLAPRHHWSLHDLENRAPIMLMNTQRLITYLTSTNEFAKPFIPGSYGQEEHQQRKKAIAQIIVKFRTINQTLDHYLSFLERGEELKILGLNS